MLFFMLLCRAVRAVMNIVALNAVHLGGGAV